MFYLDNTDWNEDREITTHNLLLVGFQDCHPEDSQLDITIPKSQTLTKNSCGTLSPCSKPEKEQFQRTQGMSDYLIGQDRTTSEAIHRHFTLPWIDARSIEKVLVSNIFLS